MTVFSIEGKSLKLDTAESVQPHIDALKALEDVREVRLSGNTFGVEAARAMAGALATLTNIERANLSDIFTGRLRSEIPQALRALCDALIDKANLVELDISDNAFGPVGVDAFAELLEKNSALQVLRINNNGLGPEGGSRLARALLKCQERNAAEGKPSSLRTLVCGRNRLENQAAKALAGAFEAIGTMVEVRLPQNGIRPEGISALMKALAKNTNLESLDLQDNIVKEAGADIADAIAHWPRLKRLNVGDCLLGDESVVAIAKALKDGHADLELLDLTFAEAKDDAIMMIVEALHNKEKIESLELNGNSIHEPTLAALNGALRKLGKVAALGTLEDNDITDDEFEEEEGQFAKPGEVIGDSDDDGHQGEDDEDEADRLAAQLSQTHV